MKFLAKRLQKNGFYVKQCQMDADTTIIKTVLTVAKDSPVIANDKDILSLLIHHMTVMIIHHMTILLTFTFT